MKSSFRWYGESDPVKLEYIRQIPGMRSIVSAVYDVKPGEVWPEESIRHLTELCREHGLIFDVVESIPVTEEIKLGKPEREQHIRYGHSSLFSHCSEKRRKNAAVYCPGYVMVLEGKCVGVEFLFVDYKRSDHTAGSNLREIMQNIVKIGNVGAAGSTVIHLPSFFFCHDDTCVAIFLEFFANSRFVEHHRILKS